MTDLTLPTIHLNGTAKDTLLEDLIEAREALLVAMTALEKTVPNARDYYPNGNERFVAAMLEHTQRRSRLMRVYEELGIIAEHVSESA